MELTVDQIVQISPGTPRRRAEECLRPIIAGMGEFSIDTPRRARAYLAQLTHESTNLIRLEENLNYTSVGRLREVWPGRFPTYESARPYVRNPKALALKVYGGRDDLGNREGTEDGWDFRGSGFMQLTGYGITKKCGDALGLDLVGDPDLLRTDLWVAARAAAWVFAVEKRCIPYADLGTEVAFRTITRKINGAYVGWPDRLGRFRRARLAIPLAA